MDDDVLEKMRARDAELARERERQRKSDGMAPAATLISDLAAAIARASEVCTATDADIAAMEARAQTEAQRDRLSASGIGRVLRATDKHAVIEQTLSETEALRKVRNWLALATRTPSPGRNVCVLCGDPGLGKTVAAAWALARCGGLYVKVDEYLRDYDRWQRDRSFDERTSTLLVRYKRAHLVVVDELGRERNAELARDAIYDLIDSRQTRRRELTLIITNLSVDDMNARLERGVYDERTSDRLARDGWVTGVSGKSMRRA